MGYISVLFYFTFYLTATGKYPLLIAIKVAYGYVFYVRFCLLFVYNKIKFYCVVNILLTFSVCAQCVWASILGAVEACRQYFSVRRTTIRGSPQ